MDYAALQTRVKDDLAMVKKRKRMLQTFLNRVARHPQLGRDHVFHRFLENGVIWVRRINNEKAYTNSSSLIVVHSPMCFIPLRYRHCQGTHYTWSLAKIPIYSIAISYLPAT